MGSGACGKEGSLVSYDSTAAVASPIQQFFFFHKAIRAELQCLCLEAQAIGKGRMHELQLLQKRFELLRLIYAQHSNAEDEVIFPALDSRIKNIAPTYALEHKNENDLFDLMSELLCSVQKESDGRLIERLCRQIICCTEAIQTSLGQHMSKEEEQVFPLLTKHFNAEEQAVLVWQFLCRIPVHILQELLPWIASLLSEMEREAMLTSIRLIVPKEDSLQHVVLSWLKAGRASEKHSVDIVETIYSPWMKSSCNNQERVLSSFKTGSKRSVHNILESDDFGFDECSRLPVNDVMVWHGALEKELLELAEEARMLQVSMADFSAKLSLFSSKSKFLMEVRVFYSAAEDNIIFPAVLERTGQTFSFVNEHVQEELLFRSFQSVLETAADDDMGSSRGILDELLTQAGRMVENVQSHLSEESGVFPLLQKHFTKQEQQALFYHSLRTMPLKVLEQMLPWLSGLLSGEEMKDMLQNIKEAGERGPVDDEALIKLLVDWATRGKKELSQYAVTAKCAFSYDLNEKSRSVRRRFTCYCETIATQKQVENGTAELIRAFSRSSSHESDSNDFSHESVSLQSCRLSSACASTSSGCCLFCMDRGGNTKGGGATAKPIDSIFQFHKAIQRDLNFIDNESEKVVDSDEEFLRQFTGRFMLLWGQYRAHSNAEDDILFPALEAQDALRNISHSYAIDHEQEEKLFKDIAAVLTELSDLHVRTSIKAPDEAHLQKEYGEDPLKSENLKRKLDLSAKLQGMCKSVHISLNQHISREERELWPLFNTHFSIQEQERIVGRIIGSTGAEVLLSMIPWVTAALSLEEQSSMIDTWLQATRNTMFDQWLHACFPSSPLISPRILASDGESTQSCQDDMPEPGSMECLKMMASYLAKDSTHESFGEKVDEVMDSTTETEAISCEVHLQEENKFGVTASSYPPEASGCKHLECTDEKYGCVSDKKVFEAQVREGVAAFKPGWQVIFRMNQKELEAALRKVSNDDDLNPRRKAYLMQNLMTSRWIVAQQRQPTVHDSSPVPGCSPSYHNQENGIFGCEHYKRNCKLLAACCGLLYTCRFCHDNDSDHVMDRRATKEMMCMRCLKIQPVGQTCSTPSCNNYLLARYYCGICKFFDDDKKDIYHCPYCNICRVGKGLGIDYFHCMTCNACMYNSLKVHKCREKGLENNCPICHDFMFTSKAPVKALSCGHFMHSACFQAFTSNHYTCPICCKSVGDMSVYFGMLDGLLAGEELPDEFKERKQDILCNDCEGKGVAPFHWLYHKCRKCGSYNTRVL